MFSRAPLSSRALRNFTPTGRRFASNSHAPGPKPHGRTLGDAERDALARAQRVRRANGWMSGAAVFGACAMGYAVAALLYSRPAALSTQLLPSEVAIELQDKFQPRYGSAADYRAAIDEIRNLWTVRGKGDRVSTDPSDLTSHGISDWSYHEAELPTVVVWAETTAEVQDLVRIANKYKVPITPFSGGTSLEGHFASVSVR